MGAECGQIDEIAFFSRSDTHFRLPLQAQLCGKYVVDATGVKRLISDVHVVRLPTNAGHNACSHIGNSFLAVFTNR